jgi:hypothetical protein
MTRMCVTAPWLMGCLAESAEVETPMRQCSDQEKPAVAPPPTADVRVVRPASAPLSRRPTSRLGRAHKALPAATGRRTVHNAAISVITNGHDRGLANADHRSSGWLKLLAIQAVALARVNL